MSTHTFTVVVQVDDWDEDDADLRTPQDYANEALFSASLREARLFDGYADLINTTATIISVEDA